MSQTFKALITSLSRVFLIENLARFDHEQEFLNYMRLDSIDESYGSENPVYQPDPNKPDAFIEVASFRDEKERPTSSMVQHYPQTIKLKLKELADRGCPYDLQMAIGECESLAVYGQFEKLVIWEEVSIENLSTDPVGALEPGEREKIEVTGDISAKRWYEFVPLTYADKTPSEVTTEMLDVIIADEVNCGGCGDVSGGCSKIYGITLQAGGSPGTPPDVVFSLDKGLNWGAHDIDTLGAAEDPDELAEVGAYIVVVSEDSGSLHFTLKSTITLTTDPAFTEVTTGFVAGGEPRAIDTFGTGAFIVGAGGYVYKLGGNPADGVTVLDAGSATISDLNAVDALNADFAVAVGNDGVILTIDGDLVNLLATSPAGIGTNINCVKVKNENEWFIGTATGALWATKDAGVTWTDKTTSLGATLTNITAIEMSSNSVMYLSGTVAGRGYIWESTNSGQAWTAAKRGTGLIPNNDQVNALATCEDDVDFVVGVGLASDGADGYIVIGSD